MVKKTTAPFHPEFGVKLKTPENVLDMLRDLATTTSAFGNYGVGAVIIDKSTKEIVAIGLNTTIKSFHYSGQDFMNAFTDGHAEMNALRAFYRLRDTAKPYMDETAWKERFDPSKYELWTNIQPCQMCAAGIHQSKIQAKYVALDDIIVPPEQVYQGEVGQQLAQQIQRADGTLTGAYEGVCFDNEKYVEGAVKPFDDTKDAVRETKKSMEASAAERIRKKTGKKIEDLTPINLGALIKSEDAKDNKDAEAILTRIKATIMDYDANTFGYNAGSLQKTIEDPKVWKETAKRAQRSERKGNARNAVTVIDPYGSVWFTVGDKTGDNPLRTPLMRAMKRVEEIWTSMPDELKVRLPRPGQFTYISYKEPTMLEAARAATVFPGNDSIQYMIKDEKAGVISTGQRDRMGDFYLNVRNLKNAFLQVPHIAPALPKIEEEAAKELALDRIGAPAPGAAKMNGRAVGK